MQTFNTADTRFEFVVDGRKLWLPGMTPEIVREVGDLSKIEDKTEQFAAFRDVIAAHVGPPLSVLQRLTLRPKPAQVIRQMSFRQLGEIGKSWSGMNLGNSSSSSV